MSDTTSEARTDAGPVTVTLEDEVVLDSMNDLHATLSNALAAESVILDAGAARFIDTSGWQLLAAFTHARNNVEWANVGEALHQQATSLGLAEQLRLGEPVASENEAQDEDDLCPVF